MEEQEYTIRRAGGKREKQAPKERQQRGPADKAIDDTTHQCNFSAISWVQSRNIEDHIPSYSATNQIGCLG